MEILKNNQRSVSTRPETATAGSTLAKTAWVVLLLISILGVLNHAVGVATFASSRDEQLTFALFAGINL